MGVPIAVVPCLLVAVLPAGRNEPIEQLGQIALQTWLELNRADRGCAADIENLCDAGADAAFGDDVRDVLRDILHVPVAGRMNLELPLAYHGIIAMGCGIKPGLLACGSGSSTITRSWQRWECIR